MEQAGTNDDSTGAKAAESEAETEKEEKGLLQHAIKLEVCVADRTQ